MNRSTVTVAALGMFVALSASAPAGVNFDSEMNCGTEDHGDYALAWDVFPSGEAVGGANASGGVTYCTGESAFGPWSQPEAFQAWSRNCWSEETSGTAPTMKGDDGTVCDRSTLEIGTRPSIWSRCWMDSSESPPGLHGGHGISDSIDRTDLSHFAGDEETWVDQISRYVPENRSGAAVLACPFAFSAEIRAVVKGTGVCDGIGMLADTGPFLGTVFSGDSAAGSHNWSAAGVVRPAVGSSDDDPIYQLIHTPDTPVSLPGDKYFFNHQRRDRR